MIYILCLMMGLLLGAGAMHAVHLRIEREAARPVDLNGLRWERGSMRVTNEAIRHLRRHYPTHDLVTHVPFLDLVQARGPSSDAVARRCIGWNSGVVMIDKRTGDSNRVILWSDDAEIEQKCWILRRVGYRVIVVDRDGEEQRLLDLMAA